MKPFAIFVCLFAISGSCCAYTITEKVPAHINRRIDWIYRQVGEESPFRIERVEYSKEQDALLCYADAEEPAVVLRKNDPPDDGFSAPLLKTENATYVLSVPAEILYTDFENRLRMFVAAAALVVIFGGYYAFSDSYRRYVEYRVASSLHPEAVSQTQAILKRAGVRCRVSTKLCMGQGTQISAGKTTILLVHKNDLHKANRAVSENG